MIANGGKIWKNGIQPGRVGILHGDLMEYQDYFKEFGRLSNRIVMYEMRKLVSLSAFCVQAFQEPFSWVTIDTEIGFRNTAKTLLAAGVHAVPCVDATVRHLALRALSVTLHGSTPVELWCLETSCPQACGVQFQRGVPDWCHGSCGMLRPFGFLQG